MIKIKNLSKKYGAQVVLDDINLEISSDEKLLISGQNGAGKTTLMKAILGEIICKGSVEICGFDPLKNRKEALLNLSFVPQNPPPLRLRVGEICEYAINSGGANLQSIKNYLANFDFSYENEANKPFYKLSGGMKQKILISLALSRNSQIIMFDEPTANLDPKARLEFLNLLNDKFRQKCLIFISHRLSEVQGLVSRSIEMDLGKITSDKEVI
ncbi:MAG: ABC transporter ATP-binding protein [Campylobacter sp.]|nr:ABC transporter ATP-binding protein [Campylobacter sp.]